MSIITALGLDTRDLKRGQQQYNATFRDMSISSSTSLKNVQGEIGKLKSGLEAAGVAGDKLGKIGALAGNLSPLALAGTAIAAVWRGITMWVDKYKESLAEATVSAGKHLEVVRGNSAHIEKWVGTSRDDLNTLLGFRDKGGELSHVEMNAAADALERLKDRYGDLNITIDKTTKQVYMSDSAMRKIATSNRDQIVAARKSEYEALLKQQQALADQANARFTSSSDAETYRKQAAEMTPQIEAAKVAWARAMTDNDPQRFIDQTLRRYRAERNDRDDAAARAEEEKRITEEQKKQLELEKQAAAYRDAYGGGLQGIREQMLTQLGMGRQAEQERALRELEKAKGRPLTVEEQQQAAKLGDLRYGINQLGQNRQTFETGIQSNDLSSLGGWYSAVVMPDTESISASILTEAQQMRTVLEEIQTLVANIKFVGG